MNKKQTTNNINPAELQEILASTGLAELGLDGVLSRLQTQYLQRLRELHAEDTKAMLSVKARVSIVANKSYDEAIAAMHNALAQRPILVDEEEMALLHEYHPEMRGLLEEVAKEKADTQNAIKVLTARKQELNEEVAGLHSQISESLASVLDITAIPTDEEWNEFQNILEREVKGYVRPADSRSIYNRSVVDEEGEPIVYK